MKTYIAQRQINHDNVVYEEFHLIDLDDKAAKPLLDIGAIAEKTEVSLMQEQDESDEVQETETESEEIPKVDSKPTKKAK